MLLPFESCAFSAKNNQVQRSNILCWTFALKISVAAVSYAGHKALLIFFIIIPIFFSQSQNQVVNSPLTTELKKVINLRIKSENNQDILRVLENLQSGLEEGF